MTDAERRLWLFLKRKQINGLTFYRQRPIGPYVIDFYCARARLVIEVDGAQHLTDEGLHADATRDAFLRQEGLKILRFDNRQVLAATESVVEEIRRAVKSSV
jgi:very-short-patch-repair endonuclease